MVRTGVVVTLVALALAMGCGSKAASTGKPKVAVSIFPLYDVTRRIAGDRLEVLLVLPPGKSEHGYDPTPKEIARLDGAKLAIAVGLDMDTWVEDIMKSAGSPKVLRIGDKVPTMAIAVEPIGEDEHHDDHDDHDDHDKAKAGSGSAAKHDDHDDDHDAKPAKGSGSAAKHDDHDDHDDHDAKPAKGSAGSAAKHDDHDDHDAKPAKGSAGSAGSAVKHDDHDDHDKPAGQPHHDHAAVGAPDPHVWMDPDRMRTIVDAITAELSAIDPAGKDTYAKNAAAIKTSLQDVDAKIAARSKAWTKRTIVTFHGSMQYFAKRYNIRIAAVVEPIAGKEPTASYIADVIGAIKTGKAAALFTEPQLERAPGEVIAKEAGIPLGELDPVGGVPGRDTYELLLTWNADQLEKALK